MAIPEDCDRNADPVPAPSIVPKEDLGLRAAKFGAALTQANGKLEAVKTCDQKVRDKFGGK